VFQRYCYPKQSKQNSAKSGGIRDKTLSFAFGGRGEAIDELRTKKVKKQQHKKCRNFA
jgi:hypothetical protein